MVGVNLYDARRELLRTPGEHEWCGGSATNASHDPNGNMTTATMPTAVAWTFSYDAENRMLSASASGGAGGSYSYDILDHRSAKLVSAVYTMFLGDAQDEEIAEYKHVSDGGTPDWTPVLLRRFVPGPATDQPIAMVDVTTGSAVRTYFHVNRLGSVIAMSGDTATKTEGPYTYDPYGNLCGSSGAPGCTVPGGVPFKFTGRRFDPETGLYYYRARYYSPQLGRFVQTDPIGYKDDLNVYTYVRNDPIGRIDPLGLESCRQAPCPDIPAASKEATDLAAGTPMSTPNRPNSPETGSRVVANKDTPGKLEARVGREVGHNDQENPMMFVFNPKDPNDPFKTVTENPIIPAKATVANEMLVAEQNKMRSIKETCTLAEMTLPE